MGNPAQETRSDAQVVDCKTAHGSCKACQRKGWPVMLVRRVFSAESVGITNKDDLIYHYTHDNEPLSARLKSFMHRNHAIRNIRMLREGHVYALIADIKSGKIIYTYHYAVTPEGFLRLASVANGSGSGAVKNFPQTCQNAPDGHSLGAASIHIDEEFIGKGYKLLLAFANDEWCFSVLSHYQEKHFNELSAMARFKCLDIDKLIKTPQQAGMVQGQEGYASSSYSRRFVTPGVREKLDHDVYALSVAPILPLEMAYTEKEVATAHPIAPFWHRKTLSGFSSGLISHYRNSNTTQADRDSNIPPKATPTPNTGGASYQYTDESGRTVYVDRNHLPPAKPTENYKRVDEIINSRAIPLVILDDPVGDVWELNFMRQLLEVDRFVWESNPERLMKKVSQEIIDSIVWQNLMACQGKNPASYWYCRKTSPALDHFESYYSADQMRDFKFGYQHVIDCYNNALRTCLEQHYDQSLRSKEFLAIVQNDYASDASSASIDDRESATLLTKMLGKCLEGGALRILYKGEDPLESSKEHNLNMDEGKNLVLKLWQEWLEDANSLYYKALFRNNKELLNQLKTLFTQDGPALDVQTLVDSYLKPLGSADLQTFWRSDALRPEIDALILAVASARQSLGGEELIATYKIDKAMQIAAAIYEGIAFGRTQTRLSSTDDIETILNAQGFKGRIFEMFSQFNNQQQQTRHFAITPKVEFDQKIVEFVAWGGDIITPDFVISSRTGNVNTNALDGIMGRALVGNVSKVAGNGFAAYYAYTSLQDSYRNFNMAVGDRTDILLSLSSSFISMTTLIAQAVSLTVTTVGVVAVKYSHGFSHFIPQVSSIVKFNAALGNVAARVGVYASLIDVFSSWLRLMNAGKNNENDTALGYRFSAFILYALAAIVGAVGLFIGGVAVLIAGLISLLMGVLGVVFDSAASANSHSPLDRWIHRTPWGKDHLLQTPSEENMADGVSYRWSGEEMDFFMGALQAAVKGVEPYIAVSWVGGQSTSQLQYKVAMPEFKVRESGFSALGYVQRTGVGPDNHPINYAVFKRKSGDVAQDFEVEGPTNMRMGYKLDENIQSQTQTEQNIVASRNYKKVPGLRDAEVLEIEADVHLHAYSIAFAIIHARFWPDYQKNSHEMIEVLFAEGKRERYSANITRTLCNLW